ncbi:MAG: imidazole glycerol phosphate synthase subunit HisF [Gemmatimonadota bacterium]
MLSCRVIPCLDTTDGRVVKGVRFQQLRDAGSPVELAERYEAAGADELVVLDVTATTSSRDHALDTVRAIRNVLSIPLTVGGGIRNVADAVAVLEAGADKVAVNTAAYRDPTLITALADRFGAQCVTLSIDAAAAGDDWIVVVRAGTEPTVRSVVEWARLGETLGAGEILLTSMDRDGTRSGYHLPLLRSVATAVGVPVVASGGAKSAQDMVAAIGAGADAVLAASMFHDGDTTIAETKRVLRAAGVEVRL